MLTREVPDPDVPVALVPLGLPSARREEASYSNHQSTTPRSAPNHTQARQGSIGVSTAGDARHRPSRSDSLAYAAQLPQMHPGCLRGIGTFEGYRRME